MCTAMLGSIKDMVGQKKPPQKSMEESLGGRPAQALDVPLGSGMAGGARLAILNRRQQIRNAVGE